MNTILIIDDEEKLRNLLSKIIALEGFEVVQAGDEKSAWKKLQQHDIDVVICDVKLPGVTGLELLSAIKEKHPTIEIILLTAYGNIPDSVTAIKSGAFDYLVKGDDNNKIIPLLHKALEKTKLSKRIAALEKQLGERYGFDAILGKSTAIQNAVDAAQKVAGSTATVLLTGETGTGKEVFAQAIHTGSPRAKGNFVAINCASFSKELLENELFGHQAGAFTGAVKATKGLLEEAHNGTIFLDEIGEMPIDLQAKLLRVLETGEFLKLGDSKPTKVDVRVLAATNRDLPAAVENGQFRADLYYRIAVFQIALPPLRERLADIEALASQFLNQFAHKAGKKITGFSPEYLEALQQHQWKGNIRELRNIIERSVILTDSGQLSWHSLPAELQQTGSAPKPTQFSAFELASVEKLHIQKVLNYTQGNKTETARLLNIALTTLYRKISEYGLN